MAELGNLFGNAGVKDAKVEVEMLDYGYISECKDWTLLNTIVDVLKSGKEGHYPDLIRFAEEKLVELLPPKEKKRYMSLSHNTTPSEIAEAEADLQAWRRSVMAKDAQMKALETRASPADTKIRAPIRGGGGGSGMSSQHRSGEAEAKSSHNGEIAECTDLDVFAFLNGNQRKKLEKLQLDLCVSEMSALKRQYKANLERTKGNESFRIADNNDAVACYSTSLAYDARNAVVWANRAMAYIRLELFDLAEADSSVALQLDPRYVKAYSRRGLVRFKRGKYAEAVRDFKLALELEPAHAELQKLLNAARDKYQEVEGVPLDDDAGAGAGGDVQVEMEQEQAGGYSGATLSSHTRSQGEGAGMGAYVVNYLLVDLVHCAAELLLPPAYAELVAEGSLQVHEEERKVTVPAASPAGVEGAGEQARFVRVSIVSEDSDSDSDEGDDQGEKENRGGAQGGGFCRVAITEDDDNEEEQEHEKEPEKENSASDEQVLVQVGVEELKERGNQLMKAGKLLEAVATYTRCLDLVPTYLPALNNRAQAHISLKNFNEAARDCSAVLAQEPGNPKALYRRAVARQAMGNSAGAAVDLGTILRCEPSNSPAQQLLDQIRSQAAPPAPGSTNKSSASLPHPPLAAATAQPPVLAHVPAVESSAAFDAQKLKQRAQQLLGDGLNDKVIALLAQYLRTVDKPPFSQLLQSDQTSLLHLLATAYSSTEDYQHAVAVQETILRLDPTNFRALYKRAENQLQLATQLQGEAKTAAFELADQDIAAALKVQSNTDVLALRQRLLRLRNTAPPTTNAAAATSPSVERALPAASHTTAATRANTSTTITPVQLQGRSASRQQSDAQKELGNTAMAEKLYSTAVMHYSNAIKFDATNLAAFNNRALAYLKLNDFALAESDASCVVESKDSANAGVQALRLKALCRRAQARRAMAEAHLAEATAAKSTDGKATAAKCAQDKLESSMRDLQQLLKDDANNKTALVEQKAVRDAMKRCSDLLEPAATVSGKQAASATSSSSASPMPVPRADPSRVSAMLSPSSTGSLSFGDIGLVARSSKKLRATADGTDTEVSPATPTPSAPPSGIGSNNSAKNGKGAVVSPPPSIALTAAPSDPPKTVYEFERVWRGLKGRPDLFAQYIGCFKKSTFKKVLKEAVSPDLISFMWTALRDHASSPEVQLKALVGFSSAPSFTLTLSLLPAQDLACLRDITASLAAHADSLSDELQKETFAQKIDEVRSLYGFT